MNRPARLAVAALLAGLACSKTNDATTGATDAGGDGGAAAPADELKAVAETESNDTPQSAQKITESSRVAGQISAVQPATKPDEDWYIIVPAVVPQDLSVAMVSELPGTIQVEVYDRDRNKIMTHTAPASPARSVVFPQLRVRDQLYLRLAAPKISGKYTLELKLSPPDPDREAEPNDKPLDATALPLDHPMHGTYGTEGDQDFFVVELTDAGAPAAVASSDAGSATTDAGTQPLVAPSAAEGPPTTPADAGAPTGAPTGAPAGAPWVAGATAPPPSGILRIDLTGVPGIRHSVTVYDDNQVPFATFTGHDVGGALNIRDVPLRAGMARVTLLLESAPIHKKRPSSEEPYTLTVRREPAPPDVELEPNDTADQATPIATHRVGWLSPQGDVDVYKVHLDTPMRVHAVLSALDRVDTELQVLEPDPASAEKARVVLKVNEGGPKEPEVIPALTLSAGDHYFRVLAASHKVGDKWVRDQEDPDQTYSLDLTIAADDGAFEREPNETAATATPLTVGKPLSGYLFPAKDVDVYKLDLSAQPVAAAAVLKVTGVTRVPVWLEVHGANGEAIGELLNSADPGKPGLDAVVHQKLEPAIYYLVVRAHPTNKAPGAPLSDAESAYRVSVDLE